MAVVPSPGIKVAVVAIESMNRDLGKVSKWSDLCRMKLNESKTKTVIASRSCTMHLQSPTLTIGRTVRKESDNLVLLGVTYDSKMALEKASSLGFQSSFSKAWCLEKVVASSP